jgi:phenylalanyl-tRNA synthetase beta chain
MQFTYSWLQQHLKTTASVMEIASSLDKLGLEVEEIHDNSQVYAPFLIAEIVSAEQHPDADKLRVCKVFDGKQELQIVCGAKNARAGIKVVLAPIGAHIPAGDFIIKKSKIRGVESNGMLCAAEELNLPEESEGIMELPENAPVGNKYMDYAGLNDVVFDISLTPNRGDCASVHGIARDLSALGLGELQSVDLPQTSEQATTDINVIIDAKEQCPQFYLKAIKGVKNGKSPQEIRGLMEMIGSSPKSALVDLSNFAMMQFGRPNHIYDADKIKGDLTIRYAKPGEPFVAIGGEEYKLSDDILVVADAEQVLAVAGVIGGEFSKVTEETTNIYVEVAVFDPVAVATSGRKLNIITDSRFRFERRVDSGNSEFVMNYLTSLINQYCGGNNYTTTQATGTPHKYTQEITIDAEKIVSLIGLAVSRQEIDAILTKLGFRIQGDKAIIPTWRYGDITGNHDLAEEILRIYGLDNLASQPLPCDNNKIGPTNEGSARGLLTAAGLNETISWSFISEELFAAFSKENPVKVANPISIEMSCMRPSIIASLLQLAHHNIKHDISHTGFFEIGSVYHKDGYKQNVSGIRFGSYAHKSVHRDEHPYDFYDVKADFFKVVEAYGFKPEKLQFDREVPFYYHPGKAARFKIGKQVVGYCGELHPSVLELVDIKENLVAFEVITESLPTPKSKTAKPKLELSDLQSINRDFAFIVNKEVLAGDICQNVISVDKKLIEKVDVFDVYAGKGIEEGKKSIALSVKIQPKNENLNEEQINTLAQAIIGKIEQTTGGSLRE